MANHNVYKSSETGNFVVADKAGKILHTFPSEGEAMLQVKYLDEQEKQEKTTSKEGGKADKEDEDDNSARRRR